jgi:hypothetical protein
MSSPLSLFISSNNGSPEICTTPSPVLSTFATSVYHLIFTHVIIGAGLGIVVVPVNVIQTEYFRCDTRQLKLLVA